MTVAKVSSKGQVVIPAYLRKKYGINAPGRVMVVEKEGKLLITPLPDDPIKAAKGMLTPKRALRQAHQEYKEEELRLEKKHEQNLP